MDDDLLEADGAASAGNVHRVAGANGDGDGRVRAADLRGAMREVRRHMLANAEAAARAGAARAMTILTPYECVHGTFDARAARARVPDAGDMAMLARAAAAALAHMERLYLGGTADAAAWLQLFKPSLRRFDVIVRLSRASIPGGGGRPEPGAGRGADASYSAKKLFRRAAANDDGARHRLLVGFSPVAAFLERLSARYGGRLGGLRAYYDADGGDVVGIALGPDALAPRRDFRIRDGHALRPGGGGNEMNVDDLLADIRELGAGLVAGAALASGA